MAPTADNNSALPQRRIKPRSDLTRAETHADHQDSSPDHSAHEDGGREGTVSVASVPSDVASPATTQDTLFDFNIATQDNHCEDNGPAGGTAHHGSNTSVLLDRPPTHINQLMLSSTISLSPRPLVTNFITPDQVGPQQGPSHGCFTSPSPHPYNTLDIGSKQTHSLSSSTMKNIARDMCLAAEEDPPPEVLVIGDSNLKYSQIPPPKWTVQIFPGLNLTKLNTLLHNLPWTRFNQVSKLVICVGINDRCNPHAQSDLRVIMNTMAQRKGIEVFFNGISVVPELNAAETSKIGDLNTLAHSLLKRTFIPPIEKITLDQQTPKGRLRYTTPDLIHHDEGTCNAIMNRIFSFVEAVNFSL